MADYPSLSLSIIYFTRSAIHLPSSTFPIFPPVTFFFPRSATVKELRSEWKDWPLLAACRADVDGDFPSFPNTVYMNQTAINSAENRGWIFACPSSSLSLHIFFFTLFIRLHLFPSSSYFFFYPHLFATHEFYMEWLESSHSLFFPFWRRSLMSFTGKERKKERRGIKRRRKMRMKQWPLRQLRGKKKMKRERTESLAAWTGYKEKIEEDDPWSLMTLQTFRTLDSPPSIQPLCPHS